MFWKGESQSLGGWEKIEGILNCYRNWLTRLLIYSCCPGYVCRELSPLHLSCKKKNSGYGLILLETVGDISFLFLSLVQTNKEVTLNCRHGSK